MKVAIVGFELEGRSALEYWQKKGAEVTICDQSHDKEIPKGVNAQLGENYLDNLGQFDLIVRTPGLHPDKILAKNPDVSKKITTNIEEFLRVCPTKNIIGVTGTKGKGTTSMLITQMLQAAGKHAFLGGNYGIPALTFLDELWEDSWVVLELSSFMLYDLRLSPHIAVCLMVVPEHLDWHKDNEDYFRSKANLFANQKADDIAIYFAQNEISRQITANSPGQKVPYFAPPGAIVRGGKITIEGNEICRTDELKLLGQHNWQNACAALTAFWQAEQNTQAAREVLTTFSGLPHRLEFVREVNGVKYYNDSFGTTPETTEVAVKSFDVPKILIVGGSDKGVSFEELAKTVAESNVREVLVIGQTADKITAALQKLGFNNITPGGKTMPEIIAKASAAARPGDVVLLSPGCASFGMFKNYKDRGEQFKAAVNAL